MLRFYLTHRRRWVIQVDFASGAVGTYGLFTSRQEAEHLLASRWTIDPTPDPHDKYADVLSASVRRRHAGEPLRPVHDLMGRRFIQV